MKTKKAPETNPEEQPDQIDSDFDPGLRLAVAETWWQLGKRITPLLDLKDEERAAYLEEWRNQLATELVEDDMAMSADSVTVTNLESFAITVLQVLEKKYDQQPIADEVLKLIKDSESLIGDDGLYLRIDEPGNCFWALEYKYLLGDLVKPKKGKGWLNAVTRCQSCHRFFIKQRKNQIYHSELCRLRFANRKSYVTKKANRPKSKRGRPQHGKGGR